MSLYSSSSSYSLSSSSYGPPIKNIELDITIIQGRNLVPNEGSLFGKKKSSDPYAAIFWGGEKCGKTKKKSKTLFPEWNENFKISVESKYMQQILNGHPSYSMVDIVLFDKDKFSRDDALGTVSIPLTFMDNPTNLPATWYTLQKGKEPHYCKKASGELEIKISVSVDKTDQVPIKMMGKGETIRLNDHFHGKQIPNVLLLQLGWDATDLTKIDPHVSAICFDHYLNLIDIASFKQFQSKDGSIMHALREKQSGETISLYLGKINPAVTYICIVINSYKGKNIDCISEFSCSLEDYADSLTPHTIATYNFSKSAPMGKHSAILMYCLYRYQTSNVWMVRAVSEAVHGKRTNDVVDALQDILHQTVSFSEQPPLKHSSGPRAELVVEC